MHKGLLSEKGDQEDWIGLAFHSFAFEDADLQRVRLATLWYVLFFLMDDSKAKNNSFTANMKCFYMQLRQETKRQMSREHYVLFREYLARSMVAANMSQSWETLEMWKRYRLDDSFAHLGYILGCFALGVNLTPELYQRDALVNELVETGSMVVIYRNEIGSYHREIEEAVVTGKMRNLIHILIMAEKLSYEEALEKAQQLCHEADEKLATLMKRACTTSFTHSRIAKVVNGVVMGCRYWEVYSKRYTGKL